LYVKWKSPKWGFNIFLLDEVDMKKNTKQSRISAVASTAYEGVITALANGGGKNEVHEEFYETVLLLALMAVTGGGHLSGFAAKHNTLAFCADLAKAVDEASPADHPVGTRLM
jgi:hypothetical protein